jgi:hypothetical protein
MAGSLRFPHGDRTLESDRPISNLESFVNEGLLLDVFYVRPNAQQTC